MPGNGNIPNSQNFKPAFVNNALKNAAEQKAAAKPTGGIIGKLQKAKSD